MFTDTHLTKKEIGSLSLPGCDMAAGCCREDFASAGILIFARIEAFYGKLEDLPAPFPSMDTFDIQISLRRTRDSRMRITGTGSH